MKNPDKITACVIDHGLYIPLARKLAETYQRVLYHTPWEKGFPLVNDCTIGKGFDDIERCDDPFAILDDIDLFVFPDIGHQGLQEHLKKMGFPVWGSFGGTEIERDREMFMGQLQDSGLQEPTYAKCVGVTALREHLSKVEDKYIKISKYRGTMETWHWRNIELDGGELDALAVQLGGVKELVEFLVFDAIDTDIEIGGDTYCINRQFPSHMLEAYEWKDKSAFGAFKSRDNIAKPIREVMEKFAPWMGDYANFFSMEIRVKGDEFWFTDPCCRGPMPMTCSQIEMYENLAEIILLGAYGELIDPVPTGNFTCECALKVKTPKDQWTSVRVPDELEGCVKLNYCGCVDGLTVFPPDEMRGDVIGWLVSVGDTPEETIHLQMERSGLLPDGVECCTDSLVDLLAEIHNAGEDGMPLTDHKIPEPETIVEDK